MAPPEPGEPQAAPPDAAAGENRDAWDGLPGPTALFVLSLLSLLALAVACLTDWGWPDAPGDRATNRIADFTMIQIVLSSLGAALLLATLHQSRRAALAAARAAGAATEANRIARANVVEQNRPWISSRPYVMRLAKREDRWEIQLAFTLTNHGVWPALDVGVAHAFIEGGAFHRSEMEVLYDAEWSKGAYRRLQSVVYRGPTTTRTIADWLPERADPMNGGWLVLCICYRAPGDETIRCSAEVHQVRKVVTDRGDMIQISGPSQPYSLVT